MRYRYLKKELRQKKKGLILFSIFSLVLGTLTLLWAFFPILTYQLADFFSVKGEISPLPKSVLASSLEKGLGVYNDDLEPYYSSYLKDYTRVANWFPKKHQTTTGKNLVKEYTITIPKLGLNKILVKIGTEDLTKSLVQFSDKIIPGELGNIAVLGHSTLPQLYKENDYKSIFTYLSSLEKNDLIKVEINGFIYEYIVFDNFVVDPADIWVLDTKNEQSLLSLITCVPPGTFWKRLVVRAKLAGI